MRGGQVRTQGRRQNPAPATSRHANSRGGQASEQEQGRTAAQGQPVRPAIQMTAGVDRGKFRVPGSEFRVG